MKKIYLLIAIFGMMHAQTANVSVASCTDNGDGSASYDIYSQSDFNVYGVQFLIDPGTDLTGFNGWVASGGLAEEAGFSVQLGANNGMLIGFSMSGSYISSQAESAHLTTIPYTVADGVDPCSLSMDLIDATPGENTTVWDNTFIFSGHIFSSFVCSDGVSANVEDCNAAGGAWENLNTDYSWTGLNDELEGLLVRFEYEEESRLV